MNRPLKWMALKCREEKFPILDWQRIIDKWDVVVGPSVARYTTKKYISNQVLHVKINNPALRQDLSMMRQQLLKRLNDAVGRPVIVDVVIS